MYRRLRELEQHHLIEALRLGTALGSGGTPLYHLSPAGLQVCASWTHTQPTVPVAVAEEREKLLRLLPRLPVWLPLQELVNQLVSGAPAVLAPAGNRAAIVQWNWQRDVRQRFLVRGHTEQWMTLHLDGVLTWRLRPSSGMARDHWQTLLLLHCPLDDLSLLRRRLDRVLRWQEAEERQAVSSQMPALLILATNAHQAELWHLAAAQVTARLHRDGILGAMASRSTSTQPAEQGWHLPWRTLGSNRPCHLQDLLHSSDPPLSPAWQSNLIASSGVQPGSGKPIGLDRFPRGARRACLIWQPS